MKISVINDEISSDFETSVEVLNSWGVKSLELKGFGEQRYPEVSDYWKIRLPQLLKEFDMSVVALTPGLFQAPAPRPPAPMHFNRRQDVRFLRQEQEADASRDYHINTLLPASIEAAKQLGAESIVCFAFQRLDHMDTAVVSEEVIQIMRFAAEKVAEAGLQLNIEVSELSGRTADIVRRANHPALGVNWDPCAAYLGGEETPFPDGYSQLKPFIRHVHFKDVWTNPATGAREIVVDGVVDWKGAIAALKRDGFAGYISIETHCRPKIDSTRRLLDRLRALIDEVEG